MDAFCCRSIKERRVRGSILGSIVQLTGEASVCAFDCVTPDGARSRVPTGKKVVDSRHASWDVSGARN